MLWEEFPRILDALPFYVMLVDASHRICFANKAVRSSLGMAEKQLVGKYCPKAVHNLDEPYPGCPLEEAAKGREFEKEYFDNEHQRWFQLTAYPTGSRTEDGEEIFYHSVRDISEHKLAEEALKNSERKYRTLFEETGDIVFEISGKGELLDTNRAGLDFFRIASKNELPQTEAGNKLGLKDGDWDTFRKRLDREDRIQDYRFYISGNGNERVVSISAQRDRDADSETEIIHGIIREMTHP